ncbi:hypothetical protein NCC78_04710 [Micromonospora phytophila]|uniref:hypothetical protein n=1 Tax=Micromonospora phytophila TaxID=709888 RepID=UPI00202E596D|nr:hypothetical protein [Micromonospora phytophila]MCM0674005.1 hypothetical protein [Micromonospora phytophila]
MQADQQVPATPDGAQAPLVVIIDDEDQLAFAELLQDEGLDAISLHPDDLDGDILAKATTVIVDQYLDNWSSRSRSSIPFAMKIPDGLSLASVLRSHVEASGDRKGPPASAVSFVLRTGEAEKIGAGLPRAAREYLLAGQYNLEWVFDKGYLPEAGKPSSAARIAQLAIATASLPSDWGPESGDPGARWLRLPQSDWAEDARWQVEQCRPPQHVVAQRTAGRAWLRWFLHRILPFPTFLIDGRKVAASLGLTTSALEEVLQSDSELKRKLDEALYQGPLNTFMGLRWWRAGVGHVINEMLQECGLEDELDLASIGFAASSLHGSALPRLNIDDPVLELSADYSVSADPISASDAVRLQPDDWPPYADEPWAHRKHLESEADPDLMALVVSMDRWHLRGARASDETVRPEPPMAHGNELGRSE